MIDMVLSSLLKIMISLTLFYSGLQIFTAIDALEIIILLVIIDIAVYSLNRAIRKHEIFEEVRVDSFRKDFEDFKEQVSGRFERVSTVNIDDRLKSHKNEVSDLIDRIARKGLDLENRINDVKKTLGAVYGAIDDRLKVAENHLGIRKESELEMEEEKELEGPLTVSQTSVEYVEE